MAVSSSELNPPNLTSKRKRGRPVGSYSRDKWYAARGVAPMVAAEILKHVDELRYWRRYLASEDDNISMRAMMFLVSMRDGRPPQQINVTSTNLTIDARDVERAREIVREIRGSHNVGYTTLSDKLDSTSHTVIVPQCGIELDSHPTMWDKLDKPPLMLGGHEGDK